MIQHQGLSIRIKSSLEKQEYMFVVDRAICSIKRTVTLNEQWQPDKNDTVMDWYPDGTKTAKL